MEDFDVTGDGKIDRFEYLSTMLIQLELVEARQIDKIMNKFDEIDIDKSGFITQQEVKISFLSQTQSKEKIPAAQIKTMLEKPNTKSATNTAKSKLKEKQKQKQKQEHDVINV